MNLVRRVSVAAPVTTLPDRAELEVVVIFTTVKRTLAALRTAASMAQGLVSHVRLVVPCPVPFPAQLDRPPVQQEFAEKKFRTLAEEAAVDTNVEILLCREWEAGAIQGLRARSIVVIGTGMRWWPVSRERRLARALRKLGHQALLVGQGEARNA